MASFSEIHFKIDHIDPLGQGVFKSDENVFFIPKTLPGESGTAKVIHSKGVVHFCELISIKEASKHRVRPDCEHFNDCGGCHFLHTSYAYEQELKKSQLDWLLRDLDTQDCQVNTFWSDQRLGYRNRLQVHYHLKSGSIGLHKSKSKKIIPVQNCQVVGPPVKEALKSLYKNGIYYYFKKPAPFGHVELYFDQGEVHFAINEPYAHRGFTQVNSEVEKQIMSAVESAATSLHQPKLLELFSGRGRLTQGIDFRSRVCVDNFPAEIEDLRTQFVKADLFSDQALRVVQNQCRDIDLLVLDPPRSGLKNLSRYLSTFKPQKVIYISCNPATFKRDLKSFEGYKLEQITLFDLFPATYHYEVMGVLVRC